MTDDAFSRKIEWKLHQFIIAFNVIIFVAALVMREEISALSLSFRLVAGKALKPMANVMKVLQEMRLFFPL